MRALAIVPVLFFHLGSEVLKGGYVGVDVFFVISGFLITGILQSEIQAGMSELKGLLGELQREHSTNRAIMQIELGFLDHLMAMLALDGVNGYDTRGTSTPITRGRPHGGLHVLDLSA